jgi:hypothetical protein
MNIYHMSGYVYYNGKQTINGIEKNELLEPDYYKKYKHCNKIDVDVSKYFVMSDHLSHSQHSRHQYILSVLKSWFYTDISILISEYAILTPLICQYINCITTISTIYVTGNYAMLKTTYDTGDDTETIKHDWIDGKYTGMIDMQFMFLDTTGEDIATNDIKNNLYDKHKIKSINRYNDYTLYFHTPNITKLFGYHLLEFMFFGSGKLLLTLPSHMSYISHMKYDKHVHNNVTKFFFIHGDAYKVRSFIILNEIEYNGVIFDLEEFDRIVY